MIRSLTRRTATAALLAIVAAAAAFVPAASAQQGTITAQACAQGRIRDSSGTPIPRARCDALIGQPVELAATGFDAWILAAAGVACVGAAAMLHRGLRRPQTT